MKDRKGWRAAEAALIEKMGSSGGLASLFEVLLAYQKLLNREAREDRRLIRDELKRLRKVLAEPEHLRCPCCGQIRSGR